MSRSGHSPGFQDSGVSSDKSLLSRIIVSIARGVIGSPAMPDGAWESHADAASGARAHRDRAETRLIQCFGRRTDRPSQQLLQHDISQGLNPVVPFIEAGDVVKFPTACLQEGGFAFDRDFFERYQAIGYKTGSYHVHAPEFLPAEFSEHVRGIGPEPLRAA